MRNTVRVSFLLTLLVLVAITSQKIQAQASPQLGIKGGVNLATFSNVEDVEYKPGILAGLFVDIKIPATSMSIQPEFLYTQFGTNIKDSDVSINVNYFQIPLLVKFGSSLPGAQPIVFFGPYMGFALKSEIKDENVSLNIDDDIEDTDYGIIIGAGVESSKFRVSVRYTAGLTVPLKETFNEDPKNGVISLTFGIGL